jgi:hypothetical protein
MLNHPNGHSSIGVVRERTPKRIIVWFGETGFGQRKWAFSDKGEPIGHTAVAFPHSKLDTSWRSPLDSAREDQPILPPGSQRK